jgi:quinol monooxygenase YgiN
MIRVDVKPEARAEVEAAVSQMFAAIERKRPAGVRYASCRVGDGDTFVIFLTLDGRENPLPAVPEFRAFQENLKDWLAGAPAREELSVIGSYNLF